MEGEADAFSGPDLFDIAVDPVRRNHVAQCEIVDHVFPRERVWSVRGQAEDLVEWRAEDQALARMVVQWFDAGHIARQGYGTLFIVHPADREHAVQPTDRLFEAVEAAHVEDRFRITMTLAHVDAEFLAQFHVVVNFSVEQQYPASVFTHHRLVSEGREVLYRQTVKAEQVVARPEDALVVGASVIAQVQCRLESGIRDMIASDIT